MQVAELRREVKQVKAKCSKAKVEAVDEAINAFKSESQREAVRAIFHAAQKTNKTGLRYTTNWIYECLLLKIKSPRTYI